MWVPVLNTVGFSGTQLFKMMQQDWVRFYIIPVFINPLWCINLYMLYACLYNTNKVWCGKFNRGGRNNLLESTTHRHPSSIYTDPATTKHTLITQRFCISKCQRAHKSQVLAVVQIPARLQRARYRQGCSKKHWDNSGLNTAH